MIYNIETNKLKATLSHVPAKDVRSFLNGVAVVSNGEYLYMVATDGHRAFFGRIQGETKPFPEIIIPRSIIEIAIKLKKYYDIDLNIPDEVNGTYSLGGVPFTPLDGKFPDMGRVIPKEISGATAQFNPKYLLDAQEALRLWHTQKNATYDVQHNGSGSAILAGGSAFVVVMPLKDDPRIPRGSTFNLHV